MNIFSDIKLLKEYERQKLLYPLKVAKNLYDRSLKEEALMNTLNKLSTNWEEYIHYALTEFIQKHRRVPTGVVISKNIHEHLLNSMKEVAGSDNIYKVTKLFGLDVYAMNPIHTSNPTNFVWFLLEGVFFWEGDSSGN